MLFLSRHRDETVCIGDEIRVLVVDISGDKVRLGIVAPVNVSVHRLEIYERFVQERKDEPKQGDDNKLLIEAAPDLLAACRQFAAAMRHEPTQCLSLVEALHAADAAIAKATGENQ